MSKDYILKPEAWTAGAQRITPPSKAYANRRKRNTGPDTEIALMRDGAWPEFIKKHYTPMPPKRVRVPMTEEERKARAHARYMADPDRKAKAHAAYEQQKAKGKRGGPAEYARMSPERKQRRLEQAAAWRAAHRNDPVTRAKNAAYAKEWQRKHPRAKTHGKHNELHPHGHDGRFINNTHNGTTRTNNRQP